MYRKIDLSNWRKIGQGSNGFLYACDDESIVLKVNKKPIAIEKFVLKEFDRAKKVASLGLQTPEAKEVVEVDGKLGIIFENVKNKKSFSRLIVDDPENFEKYVKDFVAEAKKLHSTPCNTEMFDGRAELIKKGIENAKFIKKYKEDLYKLVDEMATKTTCLHGDLQTGNLIQAKGVNYWIDLERFSYGDPIIDMAHMYTIYKGMSWFPYIQNLLHMNKKQLNKFWTLFLNEYYGFNEAEIKDFEKRLKIYNSLDLLQKNYLHKGLYADLVTLILARPAIKKYCKTLTNHK